MPWLWEQRHSALSHNRGQKIWAYQSAVLQVLSQKTVVIQGIFGFPCHPVNWSFVHLVFDSSEQHVKGLPNRILAWKGRREIQLAPPRRAPGLETWISSRTEDTAAEPQ